MPSVATGLVEPGAVVRYTDAANPNRIGLVTAVRTAEQRADRPAFLPLLAPYAIRWHDGTTGDSHLSGPRWDISG